MTRAWLTVLWIAVTGTANVVYSCGDNCLPSTNVAIPTCSETTGECLLGCKKDFTGPNCDYRCWENCKTCTLDRATNPPVPVCEECDRDFSRTSSKCEPCSTRCETNDNSQTQRCADDTGYCNFGCVTGYYDDTCKRPCSSVCDGKRCEQDTGNCIGCTGRKRYGEKCRSLCRAGCATALCSQDGVCDDGCEPAFYGATCKDKCPIACKPCTNSARNCTETTGQCACGCLDVTTHGLKCSDRCPANCVDRQCDQMTGNCLRRCIPGYRGLKCDRPCGTDRVISSHSRAVSTDIVPIVGCLLAALWLTPL